MLPIKPYLRWFLYLLVVVVVTAGCKEYHVTINLTPDGRCELVLDMTYIRSELEEQLRWMEADLPATSSGSQVEGQSAEEKLAQQIRTLFTYQFAEYSAGAQEFAVDLVELAEETIRVRMTVSYATVRDFIKQPGFLTELGYTHLRLDETDDGQLRFAFSREENSSSEYVDSLFDYVKNSNLEGRITVNMPGAFVSTPFSETEGSTTSLSLRPIDAEQFDSALALFAEPSLVFVAQKGDLRIELPLDSQDLTASETIGHWLPVTEAGPGFLPEARSVTTTRQVTFAESQQYLRIDEETAPAIQEESVVHARFYLPKGTSLLRVEAVNALRALDDQGRNIPVLRTNLNIKDEYSADDDSSTKEEQVEFDIHLALPQFDADVIQEIRTEAIVVSCGRWNEFRILQRDIDVDTAYDLSSILPETTLQIKKIEHTRENQGELGFQLSGSALIRYIEFQVELPGIDDISLYPSQDTFIQQDDTQAVRDVDVSYHYYAYDREGGQRSNTDNLILIFRFPDELARERVTFTIEDVDLY